MYLELKFRMAEECLGNGWELYYINEVKEKPKPANSNSLKRVYLEAVSSMIVPDEIEGLPVLSIAGKVKVPPHTEALVLPEFLTHMHVDAFYKSHIESLHIGKSLESLDFLSGFQRLKQVTISPDNETFGVDEGNIYLHHVEKLIWAKDGNIRPGTASIGSRAFTDLILTNLSMPESIEYIETDAFINCEIDEFSVSGEVKKVRERAFNHCRFKTLEFREGTSKSLNFMKHAVLNCAIEKIVLPERTRWVTDCAFEVTKLQEVELAGCGYSNASFTGEMKQLSRISMNLKKENKFPDFNCRDLSDVVMRSAMPIILVRKNNRWMEEPYW